MRETLLEHIGDIRNHRYLISGDSLPMHIALGLQIKCLSLFICTSPWEIYDYGVQKKLVSPLLEQHFYKRDFDLKATTSIPLDEVFDEVINHIN
jgi:ADP-heptose:LPS heptosyltransferase